jgi:hypothetical protein
VDGRVKPGDGHDGFGVAELTDVANDIRVFVGSVPDIDKRYRALLNPDGSEKLGSGTLVVSWNAECPIYSANASRIGLLGKDLAKNTVAVFNLARQHGERNVGVTNALTQVATNHKIGVGLLPEIDSLLTRLSEFAAGCPQTKDAAALQ